MAWRMQETRRRVKLAVDARFVPRGRAPAEKPPAACFKEMGANVIPKVIMKKIPLLIGLLACALMGWTQGFENSLARFANGTTYLDINRNNFFCAVLQQTIGKTAGRLADVQAKFAFNRQMGRHQGPGEFEPAARHVLGYRCVLERKFGIVGQLIAVFDDRLPTR